MLPSIIPNCFVCGSRRNHFLFMCKGFRLVRCVECGLLFLNPQPTDAELAEIYNQTYFLGDSSQQTYDRVSHMKGLTARAYLEEIGRYRGGSGGRLLEIGCGRGELLAQAEALGYEPVGVEVSSSAVEEARKRLTRGTVQCGLLHEVDLAEHSFDVCVLADVIEHVREPIGFLRAIHRLLKPGGVLYLATPSLDSWSARLMGRGWMEFKVEHLLYFNAQTIQMALYRAGFHHLLVRSNWKTLNIQYIGEHFERYPSPIFSTIMRWVTRFIPSKLRTRNFQVIASGMTVLAQADVPRPRPKLSLIVPAFNEASTLHALMESVLKKELPDCDIEVVLVESNSTDGTRAIAQQYADHPRVRLVLEEKPRGKGHAVRTGFEHATGDFILIQDADLEYDIEDYEAVLEPLLMGKVLVVLGSRHGGSPWKMRQFTGQAWLSGMLNFGHWFFTFLVNTLFRQRLRDPFTMYKVFRRDFLYGVKLSANRFDFDYELLIRLVQKGYKVIEVPVNYRSRSFKEGKKVSFWRDPLSWLWILFKLRVTRHDPLDVIEAAQKKKEA